MLTLRLGAFGLLFSGSSSTLSKLIGWRWILLVVWVLWVLMIEVPNLETWTLFL